MTSATITWPAGCGTINLDGEVCEFWGSVSIECEKHAVEIVSPPDPIAGKFPGAPLGK